MRSILKQSKQLNILENFPDKDEPRPEQVQIVNGIQDAINKEYKFIIIQAPTGSGKSHVAATLANSSNHPHHRITNLVDSYDIAKGDYLNGFIHEEEVLGYDPYGCAVLTVTKSLQNQYKSLFDHADVMKGKQNYVCKVDDDFDCDMAPCLLTPRILEDCKSKNRCPMLNARRNAWKSRFGVFNYSAFLTMPDFLMRRQYFICDEASELEDELVKHYSCSIEYGKLKLPELGVDKLRSNLNGDSHGWLTDLSDVLGAKLKELVSEMDKHKKNKRVLKGKMVMVRFYKNLHEKVNTVLKNWYKAEYVTEINNDSATFTPLYVNVLAQDFFKWSNTVILMSGTIIDHETFASTLGIEKDQYKYIEIDSDFDAAKSPIYCDSQTRVNYKNMSTVLPKLVDKAVKICDHFGEEKGIIHTHSFKITEALVSKIKKNGRYLIREAGMTNELLLEQHHLREDGTVLISPSLGFGTDLKDGFGRFCIIMKTPYLPLSSERIKKLAKRNQKWYEMKALINLVQMCGRTTRSKEDYSDTFILDAAAIDLIKRNKKNIPKYFMDRIH